MSFTNFIYWEELTWVVDWVNTTFTSLYPIDRVEDIRIWWADYSNFGFTWNTIILNDAPTISTWAPYIDYFRSDVITPVVSWNITFLDVINDVYLRLGQNTTSLQFPLNLIKTYIREWIRVINNVRTNPKYKVGSYSFNKANDLKIVSYSSTELNVGSTLSSYTPTSWMVLLGNSELVVYTNKNATSLLWLSWLDIVYKPWDEVCIWYTLPWGVKKPSEVLYNWKTLEFVDRREYFIRQWRNVYTLIDWFLFLPYNVNTTDDIITVNYVKDNIQPVSDSDLIDIENEYFHIISLYALYNAMMDREDDRYKIQQAKYQEQLRLYKSYLRQVDWVNNTIPSNMFRSVSWQYNFKLRK